MSAAVMTFPSEPIALGLGIPPFTPHAISVSLPTWRDNVGYEEGEKRVVDLMVSGYPRFFIHLSIQKLARICEQKYTTIGERCMLFPTQKVADQCRSFMHRRSSLTGSPVTARLVHLLICPEDNKKNGDDAGDANAECVTAPSVNLHIVLFPSDAFALAKEFWQHAGLGISSRLAEYCLSMLPQETIQPISSSPVTSRFPSKTQNRHYGVKTSHPQTQNTHPTPSETLDSEHTVYFEERFGRNLPLSLVASAKRTLRRRIAGVLLHDNPGDRHEEPAQDLEVGPSSRGVRNVSEDDVYLFPSGMAAIWSAHNLALSVLPAAKSVCFGFPYTDTLKILQKWGPGCHFLGHGLDADIDELEAILEQESALHPSTPPILALFTEFPSNPLLRSADLPRLRALADKYDFLIVVDETIGNFVNVAVLPYVDIVASSLTKVFSGSSNVMGGSLVLNPKGRHYTQLKNHLNTIFEDLYFDQDAIFMERNSRDFRRRVKKIDINTETVCDLLWSHSIAGGKQSAIIKEVFYPKYTTPSHYQHCQIKSNDANGNVGGGYGGLFSLTFTSKLASTSFFDALSCYKGPSLGTNFTLACPFTILAHYTEMDWAARYGVEEGLVRISVGMEETGALLQSFENALKAAEVAVRSN